MTFDPTKPIQTRDGRKARILLTDFCDMPDSVIVAAIKHKISGTEILRHYNSEGVYRFSERSDDLVNIPDHTEPSLHQRQIKALQRQVTRLEQLMLELPEMQHQAKTYISYYVALRTKIKDFLDDNS